MSHQWRVSLIQNNTKTIGRITCYCFVRPIRRYLTNSSYTTRMRWCYYAILDWVNGILVLYHSMQLRRTGVVFCRGGWAAVRKASWDERSKFATNHRVDHFSTILNFFASIVISLCRSGRVIFQSVSWLLSVCATYACNKVPWKGYLVLKNKEINKTLRNVEN